jgi:hypothetical protein
MGIFLMFLHQRMLHSVAFALKFNVATEAEAIKIVANAIKKGKIIKITDNKGQIGSEGQKSFEIIIDAGKVVGTSNKK